MRLVESVENFDERVGLVGNDFWVAFWIVGLRHGVFIKIPGPFRIYPPEFVKIFAGPDTKAREAKPTGLRWRIETAESFCRPVVSYRRLRFKLTLTRREISA
jgi:hypothetical protein